MKQLLFIAIFVLVTGLPLSAPAAATLLALQVGMEGPELSVKNFSGQSEKSTALKGEKLTVVVFWSTWSRKSEAVLARMQKLYERYKSKGLSIIGVNADEQKFEEKTVAEIRSLQERLKISYPFLLDDGLATFHDFGVIALPTTIVMDKAGVITSELSGYPLVGAEELADFISSSMEDKTKPVSKETKAYQPSKTAVRFFNVGRNSLKSKRMLDMAEAWFKKAAEADPAFILPHLSLGKLYQSKGEADRALAEYKEVLGKEPKNQVASCEAGILLAEQGKSSEGSVLLEAAVRAEASYTPCYYYSAYMLGKAGKPEASHALFVEAERMAPRDRGVYMYKARLLEEQKDVKRAAESYRKAVEAVLPSR